MKRLILMVIPALLLSACSAKEEQTNTSMQGTESPSKQKFDNTETNKTEKNFSAEQQSNDKKDVQISADVRKAILAQKGMSVDAQNVKIITNGGIVTLRGPVDNAAEKQRVAELAKAVEGVTSVDNQTELKGSVASESGKQTH